MLIGLRHALGVRPTCPVVFDEERQMEEDRHMGFAA